MNEQSSSLLLLFLVEERQLQVVVVALAVVNFQVMMVFLLLDLHQLRPRCYEEFHIYHMWVPMPLTGSNNREDLGN